MKLYRERPGVSISMDGASQMQTTLKAALAAQSVGCVLETGTFEGTGSTKYIAEAFVSGRLPESFVTIEANWKSWRKAKRNLARFPFVTPLWGNAVATSRAQEFIRNDDFLRHHEKWEDIYIDDIIDPVAFYCNEISGKLGEQSLLSRIRSAPRVIDKMFHYQGEDLLQHYLRRFRDRNPLVILDSAGGIGFLEFSIMLETLADRPYLLLLDDICHVKHYRSVKHVVSDPSFSVIEVNERFGWALARHLA